LLDAVSDDKGNYFVADTDNKRVQILDPDGKVVKIIKCNSEPPAVTADKMGRFLVSAADSAGNSCVKVYTVKGGYLGDLTDEKGNEIQGGHGMAVDQTGVLMVAGGERVSLYQLPPAAP
jgi:hypothetical protein